MSLKVNDLCVVQFRSKCLTLGIKQWWEEADIPYAESCDRQVWWGSQEDFKNFPDTLNFNIPKMIGTEGYNFLVKLVLGLDSKILGEDVIKGQFREGFTQFSEVNPEKGSLYEPIVQAIQADSRLVMGQVLNQMKRSRKEIVAKDLSGFSNGEEVLLISSINRYGNLSNITDRLARILGSKNKKGQPRCPKFLVLSPDPEVTKKIKEGLISLKRDHRQFSIPEIGEISDIPELIEKYPRTFVDLPMGEYPEVDEYLIEAWHGRLNRTHKMVHVRGCPKEKGLSNQMWKEANLTNYSSSEDINIEVRNRMKENSVLKDQAINVINSCSELRLNGVQPSKSQLSKLASQPKAQYA